MTDTPAVPTPAPGLHALRVADFTLQDYEAAYALWARTPGVGLSSADERPAIARFLARNPGLSFAAWHGRELVGTILCGHDGRRGLVHHLAVSVTQRRQGLARVLVHRGMQALHASGIEKCHLMVYADNATGIDFWRSAQAVERQELRLYSMLTATP